MNPLCSISCKFLKFCLIDSKLGLQIHMQSRHIAADSFYFSLQLNVTHLSLKFDNVGMFGYLSMWLQINPHHLYRVRQAKVLNIPNSGVDVVKKSNARSNQGAAPMTSQISHNTPYLQEKLPSFNISVFQTLHANAMQFQPHKTTFFGAPIFNTM